MANKIGIDEVGRGCWAGPLLVVAAKSKTDLPTGLTDSKALSKSMRESLFEAIKQSCELGEGWVAPAEIDELGLTAAMRLAVQRALKALGAEAGDEIIMDGNYNYCPKRYKNVTCVVKADALEPIVSAASIYAKVTRDKYMAEQALQYPAYGFEKHVGYGTLAHLAALRDFGICELHRLSYKPVKATLL